MNNTKLNYKEIVNSLYGKFNTNTRNSDKTLTLEVNGIKIILSFYNVIYCDTDSITLKY